MAEKELLTAWQIDSSDVYLAYSIASVKSDCYRPFEKDVKPWLDKAWEMIQPDPATMSRIHQQYGLGYYRLQDSWDKAIEHYKEAYRYNPKFISASFANGDPGFQDVPQYIKRKRSYRAVISQIPSSGNRQKECGVVLDGHQVSKFAIECLFF